MPTKIELAEVSKRKSGLFVPNRAKDLVVGRHQFVAYEGDLKLGFDGQPLNKIAYISPVIENLIVDAGKQSYLSRLGLATLAPFAQFGVGTDASAPAASNTKLNPVTAGSVYLQAVDSGYPSLAGFVLSYRITFATTVANFTWAEGAIFNGLTNGTSNMFNRVAIANFPKTSSYSVQYNTTVTQS